MTRASNTDAVKIVEVGPRDGLQNIDDVVSTRTKLELIEKLVRTGLRTVELTSAVSPRAIPQLSDASKVLSDASIQMLLRDPALRLPVLVPNLKGFEIARKLGVKEVAVFVSASEGFSKANINCTVQEGLDRAHLVAEAGKEHNILVRAYVSCIFQCPFDGLTPLSAVLNCVRQLQAMGCYEISLGDTTGVGVATDVVRLINYLKAEGIPVGILAGHFHDTYGQAVSNVWAAYHCGLRTFDTSVAGLGGCPFAPGSKGNLATEDLVYSLQQAGIKTGVNLEDLVNVGVWISENLKKANSSRAGKAISSKKNLSVSRPLPTKRTSELGSGSRTLSWKPYLSFDSLEILRSGVNIKVVLNRPKNGNALTTSMITNLTNFMESAASDPTITRIAITSKGKFFCTGMDLAKDSTPVSQGSSASNAQYERLTKMFESIDKSPQVTIACIQGAAFGGGVGLAFACDIRIMAKTGNFTLSEAKLGLSPATISKYVVREWGPAFSREAMLSARCVSAVELARLGAVSQIVKTEKELPDALDRYLERLKCTAPKASTMNKELVKLGCHEEGAGSKQEIGIKKAFGKMMFENEESAYGLAQFQAGNKTVDWDAFVMKQSNGRAKL